MVRHADIDGDPQNIRDTLPNVLGLARSIHQYGLLENLVVVEVPEHLRKDDKWLELRAGSRRFEALRQLIETGVPSADGKTLLKWPAEREIPVMVLGTDGAWEHLVENVQRVDARPWEIGRRLSEAFSSGMTARQIGARVNRSNGWVTRYVQIGTGLSPDTIEYMQQRRLRLDTGELFQLAQLLDPYGDPDGKAQIRAIETKRARKRRRRSKRLTPDSLRAYRKRITHMRTQMPLPPAIRPIVAAVLDYLEGGGRPPFRALESALFEHVERFSPRGESPHKRTTT